jgi:hypothetical protein
MGFGSFGQETNVRCVVCRDVPAEGHHCAALYWMGFGSFGQETNVCCVVCRDVPAEGHHCAAPYSAGVSEQQVFV